MSKFIDSLMRHVTSREIHEPMVILPVSKNAENMDETVNTATIQRIRLEWNIDIAFSPENESQTHAAYNRLKQILFNQLYAEINEEIHRADRAIRDGNMQVALSALKRVLD